MTYEMADLYFNFQALW